MNHKERFYATIEKKSVDRPAAWLGLPVPKALPALFKQFGANSYNGLKDKNADKTSFCVGVDAQELLGNGTPEEVSKNVLELKELFPTGLIISPTNVQAMFKVF